MKTRFLCALAVGAFFASSAFADISPVTAYSGGAITNPTSTLLMTATTTAFGANTYIAPNSGTISSFTMSGGALIPRLRLSTNDATSTAWGAVSVQVDLWSAAPTMPADRAAFSVTAGTANHLGAYSCVMSAEYGDGAYAECAPTVNTVSAPKLAAGAITIYWTLQAVSASGVTGASKTWTLTPEILN